MAYFTITEARNAASRARGFQPLCKSASQVLSEETAAVRETDRFDIFLSHCVADADVILGVKTLLEEAGNSVYVDWIVRLAARTKQSHTSHRRCSPAQDEAIGIALLRHVDKFARLEMDALGTRLLRRSSTGTYRHCAVSGHRGGGLSRPGVSRALSQGRALAD